MFESERVDTAGRRWSRGSAAVGVAGLGLVWEVTGESAERAWLVEAEVPLDDAPGLGGPLERLGSGEGWSVVRPVRVDEDVRRAMPETLVDAAGILWTVEPSPMRVGGQARVHGATGAAGPAVVKVSRRSGPGSALWREREALEEVAASPEVAGRVCLPIGHGYALGHAFVVYPRLDGTLEDWSREDPPLDALLAALREATLAVVAFHRAATDATRVRVHRDLKPSNFLVRRGPARVEVQLADLGAARSGEVGARQTMTSLYSAGFAPTDQLLGGARALDPGWDVFAMAVTVYVLLTGMFPTASLAAGADALSPEGAELSMLQRRAEAGQPLQDAEWRRLRSLAALPGDTLVRADATGWTEHDSAVLAAAIRRRAPELDPAPLVARLEPALAAALDPIPSRRPHGAIDLALALDAARALLPEPELPMAAPVVLPPEPVPPPPPEARATRWWLLLPLLGLLAVPFWPRPAPPVVAPGPGVRLVGCPSLESVRVTLDGLPATLVGGAVEARPGQRLVIDGDVDGERIRRSFVIDKPDARICYELPGAAPGGCAACR